MAKNNKTKKLNPWGYENIDSEWLDIVLGNVFKKEDVIDLLKEHGISFSKNIKKIPQKEMTIVLLADASPSELLNSAKKLFKEKYAHLLSYNDFKLLYKKLSNLKAEKLYEIYLRISSDEKFKDYISNPRYQKELLPEDIIYHILKELYKFPKDEVKRVLKNTFNKS